MKKIKWLAISLIVFTSSVRSPAQDMTPAQSEISLSPTVAIQPLSLTVDDMLGVKFLSDDQLSAFVSSLNVTPQISVDALPHRGVGQTYFSLQHPEWPPLPGDTASVPVWPMDGFYLLNDLNHDYNPPVRPHLRTSFSAPAGPGDGGGDGGTNTFESHASPISDYSTNLWIAQAGISSGSLTGVISNSQADVLYEIQSKQDLLQASWISEGFVYGSELTNWTAMGVAQNNRTNLFLRIRSWLDSNNSGIPDWWWLQYFGQITNVDASASIPGDGYSNYQKFQMGLNPVNYYNPNAPSGFFGSLDASGTNVVLEWNPSPGPATYLIQRGIYHTNTSAYTYSQIATLNSNTIFFKDNGAVSNANAFNNIYTIAATYPGGNLTATDSWQVSWYRDIGSEGPPYGPPVPGDVYAYAKSNGTNVIISWSPAPGPATNYMIVRAAYNPTNATYSYSQIAAVGTNTTYFQDTGAIKKPTDRFNFYEVQAGYIGGGLSQFAQTTIYTTPLPPSGISAVIDATGTNVFITWTPPNGLTVSNYTIMRGIYNTNTGNYTYSQIGKVSGSTTSFEDVGAITNNNSLNDIYEVEAGLFNGDLSGFDTTYLTLPLAPPVPTFHIRVTAQLARGPTGRWQLVFSSIPTNIQSLKLSWAVREVDADVDVGIYNTEIISKNSVTNNIYLISDLDSTNYNNASSVSYNETMSHLYVEAIATNGNLGDSMDAGFIDNDAEYFVDGRTHLKQNLLFKLRAATISQPCTVSSTTYNTRYFNYFERFTVPADTNYVESSLYYQAHQFKQYGNDATPNFIKLSDLWPFDVNYQLHQRLNDPSHPGVPSSFTWTNNFANPPAAAVLGISDPYWISQGLANLADVAAYTNAGNLYLNSGMKNLFGLSFAAALVNQSPQITVSPGGSVNMTNVSVFYNQTADPGLQTNGYYFARVNTPGTTLTGDVAQDQNQPYPIPVNTGFAPTNQTGLMIGSVGTPTVIGAWAKYSVSGSSPAKYAYLGQYFVTNAFLLNTNGTATTNSAGIVSPYGEFFPTQAGQAALVTMPDIDTGQQATGIVKIISINADANHDGKMDLSYFSNDQTATSHPLRFWVNDDQDSGDFGGDGIPGKTGTQADGNNYTDQYGFNNFNGDGLPIYQVHGTRDLVDFFPVYLNIGSLFQSNAISAGISATDTNYQFVVSQADGVLRFIYTDLTPTNYMKFLQDTNEAQSLAHAVTKTITPSGVTLSNSFLNGISTANQGIILVEAAASTTEPLILSIYRGSNLLAQTSLYLSITGVEQMFRSKTMLLYSQSGTVPDRLTDMDVPNEPDTIDKNFIFVHGYNVNPKQARGWNADIYKRLYWSGSHAKFYGVTWSASDSQIAGQVTINLQANIVHAFDTAPLLNTFLNSLSGTNVVMAHSLGNMVVLSTLNDYTNQNINTYFMVDAAVAIDAIDRSAPSNPDMYPSAWTNYNGNLWASDWYGLFPTNDYRSSLTWHGRLDNFQNAAVYNFYSSGEEVLRDYPNDPPTNLLTIAVGQGIGVYEGAMGVDTWVWQEKLKGLMLANGLLSSDHGGWQFNPDYSSLTVAQANALTTSVLKTNAFFNFSSPSGSFFSFTNDLALESSSGSSYAQANRNRILSDAIPCLTLPVGANPVPSFDSDHNINMQNNQNNWPIGRLQQPEGNNWHHSDIRAVAYTFTYGVFNKIVNDGNLK